MRGTPHERFAAVFIFGLLTAAGHAKATAPTLPPNADEIIAHYVEAIGGPQKVAAIHSLFIRGEYSEHGEVMGPDDGGGLLKLRPYYKPSHSQTGLRTNCFRFGPGKA